MEGARREGMVTMDRALRDLYEKGKIHWDDAQRYLLNPRAIPDPSGNSGSG